VHTLAARLFNSRSSASPTRTVTSRRPRTTSTGSSASCRRTGLGSEPALDRRGASFPTGRRASRSPSSRKPASHLYCGQHLYENVKRNHSADIASAFLKALRATTFPEYARSLGAIADLLAARGPPTTSRGSRPIDERRTPSRSLGTVETCPTRSRRRTAASLDSASGRSRSWRSSTVRYSL
jgi:hypothetical protein